MPEIEFIGNWEPAQAQAVAAAVQQSLEGDAELEKSLGVDDGGGAEVSVQLLDDNPIQELLSARQKKLLALLRQAGGAAFGGESPLSKAVPPSDAPEEESHICGPDCTHSWDDYQLGSSALSKAIAVGAVKRDAHGRTYRFNAQHRWQRFTAGAGPTALPEFRFTEAEGEFGRGVYFPVLAAPQGNLRLRVRADLGPNDLISADEFHQLENTNLAAGLERTLDGYGVQAITQADGDTVTLLCIRSAARLQVLGAVADSGTLPPGPDYSYHLVNLRPEGDHLIIDVEVAPGGGPTSSPQGQELVKAATKVFPGSLLSSTVLTTVSTDTPKLDRRSLRAAVERCRLDGIPLERIEIEVVNGRPDFLPAGTQAFCWPAAGTIYLVDHCVESAINQRLKMMARELRAATVRGALPSDFALDTLLMAQDMNHQWWLESLIKRYAGAILAHQAHDIMTADDVGPWAKYIGLLPSRGLDYWGSRRAIAQCMAEDYRCAYDPAGWPNAITMVWDLAVPPLARMAQEELLQMLEGSALAKRARHRPGEVAHKDGKTYQLNQHYRWARVKDAAIHEADEVGRLGTSWALGKAIGGAVSQVAVAHGADPFAASIISETVVQAGAATALYAAQGGHAPMDLAAYFVQQSAAACLGKLAHHGADHILETFNAAELSRQASAILAGKATGIGTAATAAKTGSDRKLVEFVVNKAGHDLALLQKLFGSDGQMSKALSEGNYEVEAALLYELAQMGAILATLPKTND